jgi:hypothetical protein
MDEDFFASLDAEIATHRRAKGGTGFGHELAGGGATVEWYTPSFIFEALGLEFDLDPCSPVGGLPWIPAKQFYSLPSDGLSLPWQGKIWCNPPYGKDTPRWLYKMNQHRNGIALVFSRTDVSWFHDYAAKADALFFIKNRIKFVDDSGQPPHGSSPGAGSMFVAWGEECVTALANLQNFGLFVKI